MASSGYQHSSENSTIVINESKTVSNLNNLIYCVKIAYFYWCLSFFKTKIMSLRIMTIAKITAPNKSAFPRNSMNVLSMMFLIIIGRMLEF